MTNELTRPLTDAEEGLWQEKLAAAARAADCALHRE